MLLIILCECKLLNCVEHRRYYTCFNFMTLSSCVQKFCNCV